MGVKTLWPVLSDVGSKCSLSELRGQTVAVDLSGWLVEGELALQHHVAKPHLKTVFWRMCALLENGLGVICVADGDVCPALKQQELGRRQDMRDKAQGFSSPTRSPRKQKGVMGSPDDGTSLPTVARGSPLFRKNVEECLELLSLMGIPYIRSEGEAEATCALLNEKQIVDGVISNDSDTFLHGASTVYRNLTASSSTERFDDDLQENEVEQVEVFSMSTIESRLRLDRPKLVALAALLGCDYSPGVHGVGKEKATTFLRHYVDGDPIERLCEWRSDPEKFEQLEKSLPKKKPHCGTCGHVGSVSFHKQSGCGMCGNTNSGCVTASKATSVVCACEWHSNPRFRSLEAELRIRNLALKDPHFPPTQVFELYQRRPTDPLPAKVQWKKPDFEQLKSFLSRDLYLQGESADKHIFRLLTAYSMAEWKENSDAVLYPVRILKKRKRNQQEKYEVEWRSADGSPMALNNSIEDVTAFSQQYPEIVDAFDREQQLSLSAKKSRGKKRLQFPEDDAAQSSIKSFFRSKKPCETTPKSAKKFSTRTGITTPTESDSPRVDNRDVCEIPSTPKSSKKFSSRIGVSRAVSSCVDNGDINDIPSTPKSSKKFSSRIGVSRASESVSSCLDNGDILESPSTSGVPLSMDSSLDCSPNSSQNSSQEVPQAANSGADFTTPSKSDLDFILPPVSPYHRRKSRIEKSSCSFSRQSSCSSSASHTPRKSTPENPRSRSRSRSGSQSSTPTRSSKRTPIRSRPFLPKEYARKVIRVDKRTKFRPRTQREGGDKKVTCRKRLQFDDSCGGVRKRLNFGLSEMLSDGIEVDFAEIPADRQRQETVDIVERQEANPANPIAAQAFYGTPKNSTPSTPVTSQTNTPSKAKPRKNSKNSTSAPATQTRSSSDDDQDVIVISPSSTPIKTDSSPVPNNSESSDGVVFQTPVKSNDVMNTQPGINSTTPKRKPSMGIPPTKSQKRAKNVVDVTDSEPSASDSPSTSKAASSTKGKRGMNRNSRRRLLINDDTTPSVKKFFKPLR